MTADDHPISQAARTPAEPSHPSVFILEEMKARDWDRDRLASAMCAQMSNEEFGINRLALDMYLEVGPNEPNLLLDTKAIARAFQISEEFWKNLEAAWRAQQIVALHAECAALRKELGEAVEVLREIVLPNGYNTNPYLLDKARALLAKHLTTEG